MKLGALLTLLHGGGRSLRTVRLTATARSDLEALFRAMERECERSGGQLLTMSAPGPASERPRLVEETTRLWLERPDKIREEKDGEFPHTGVRVGDTWWLYNDHQGLITNNGAANHTSGIGQEFELVLEPARLLPLFDFEILGDEVQAGRPAVRVRGRQRPRSEQGLFLPSPVPAGCDHYEFVVDVVLGTLLRIVGLIDGEPALDLQIVEIAFDEPIAPETFAFEPPSGKTMRDVEELGRVDPLTGLPTRSEAEAWLNRHCRRADLRDEALSIALIDIDDMRMINDSYGHRIGDGVLRSLADSMRKAVGANDLAARFGGEEFLLAWPGDDADEAAEQADALRLRFHELEIELENGDRVGGFRLSAGVAQLSTLSREERDREIVESLWRNADTALFTAKEAGGDCVRIF